jgi:hypothetical protein
MIAVTIIVGAVEAELQEYVNAPPAVKVAVSFKQIMVFDVAAVTSGNALTVMLLTASADIQPFASVPLTE